MARHSLKSFYFGYFGGLAPPKNTINLETESQQIVLWHSRQTSQGLAKHPKGHLARPINIDAIANKRRVSHGNKTDKCTTDP